MNTKFGITALLAAMPLLSLLAQSDSARKALNPKPELLTSGFVDVYSNGQTGAAARLVRLNIGDPNGLQLPLSVYAGVTAQSFPGYSAQQGAAENSQNLGGQMLNPLAGILNTCIDGIWFTKKQLRKITRWGVLYQTGLRLLTANRFVAAGLQLQPANFINTIGATGFYFQTGAWEFTQPGRLGLFWVTARLMGSQSRKSTVQSFFPEHKIPDFYYGYSLGLGIEVSRLISLRVVGYQFLKQPEWTNQSGIYQLSFQYALKNNPIE